MNNTSFESYLRDGCGRCDRFQTPECKVHRWTKALEALRKIVKSAGLEEAMKWGSPCYTFEGKNVVMITSLIDCCALNFMRGAVLKDPDQLLEKPGPNSRHARYLKFTSAAEVKKHKPQILALLDQAKQAVRDGVKVEKVALPEPMPEELERVLRGDKSLRKAFDALTPGRQRSYILHVSGAKQSETRARRAEKCGPKILLGKGFNER